MWLIPVNWGHRAFWTPRRSPFCPCYSCFSKGGLQLTNQYLDHSKNKADLVLLSKRKRERKLSVIPSQFLKAHKKYDVGSFCSLTAFFQTKILVTNLPKDSCKSGLTSCEVGAEQFYLCTANILCNRLQAGGSMYKLITCLRQPDIFLN